MFAKTKVRDDEVILDISKCDFNSFNSLLQDYVIMVIILSAVDCLKLL